jgi:antibiotic biosynthesis monooxygenase (ABM) superfamily enzyme
MPTETTTDARDPSLRSTPLADVAARGLPQPESVTAVLRHHVRPEAVADYERWLQRIMPIAQRFPGHRGVNVLRPAAGSALYTVTLRFETLAHAEDWFQSSARQTLLADLLPLLTHDEQRETLTGLEFWFQPESGPRAPKRYKQFLLTLSMIFPLTQLVPFPVRWATLWLPELHGTLLERFIIVTIVVGLMTYVVMPRVTRWVASWLHR